MFLIYICIMFTGNNFVQTQSILHAPEVNFSIKTHIGYNTIHYYADRKTDVCTHGCVVLSHDVKP